MKKCQHCLQTIEGNNSQYANHVRWCNMNTTNGDKGRLSNSLSQLKLNQSKNGQMKEFEVNCIKCSKSFFISEPELKHPLKEKYYCNRSCANSRQHNTNTKRIMSEKSKKLWEDEDYANRVITNNTNKNKRFTSKGEEEIRKHFISKYKDDEWTFGGGFKYENLILTRDLYSKKLKVIFEYDGIWHFKDIHGQLDSKIKKDQTLEKWVIKNDWRLIRIKDEIYNTNKTYYLDLIENYVYKSKEQIIKIY
jgi:very-short-patch-repair endonuclease